MLILRPGEMTKKETLDVIIFALSMLFEAKIPHFLKTRWESFSLFMRLWSRWLLEMTSSWFEAAS